LGQATGPFGTAKKSAATPTPAPQFTGEWLEIEFTDPGKHSEIVRRELIDCIGPVVRWVQENGVG
jgi:hypothetical protein